MPVDRYPPESKQSNNRAVVDIYYKTNGGEVVNKLILLSTFFNAIEAHMAKGMLESEGIESFIFDELVVSYAPLMTGIRLMVREGDLERAKSVLSRED